jgi:hypothetical protein
MVVFLRQGVAGGPTLDVAGGKPSGGGGDRRLLARCQSRGGHLEWWVALVSCSLTVGDGDVNYFSQATNA